MLKFSLLVLRRSIRDAAFGSRSLQYLADAFVSVPLSLKLPQEGESILFFQNHRILGVGRDLCGSSSPAPCQSRVSQSRLHRTSSRQVLNISREGDSTTSLGSLFQGSVTLRVKFFLMFRWNFLCFSLCSSSRKARNTRMEAEQQLHVSPPPKFIRVVRNF